MINAKQLRIGNLLADNATGTFLRVDELKSDGSIHFYVIDRSMYPLPDGWKAKHIDITPEILLNLGFNLRGKNTYYKQLELINWEYRLIHFNGWVFAQGFFDVNNEICTIKYVHQLQNLYFALTGEELEIKL